jgi:uncharacterized protein YcfL
MKKYYAIIILFSLVSCETERKKTLRKFNENHEQLVKDFEFDYNAQGVPQVKLVSKAEVFKEQAVSEKWSYSEWIKNFGNPASKRGTGNLVYLEYIQPGPYPHIGDKMITGIIVTLKNNQTSEVHYHYTWFGKMPEH